MSDWAMIVIGGCVLGIGTWAIAMAQIWVEQMRAEQREEEKDE